MLYFFMFCSMFFYHQILYNYSTDLNDNSFFSAEKHFKLNLSKIPTYKLYDNSPILFKNKNSFSDVIDIWQKKLDRGFEKLFSKLYSELDVTREEIYEQLSNPVLIARYHVVQKTEDLMNHSATFIQEEDADKEVINFIKNILYRYTTKRNIKIILTDANLFTTATYGSDLYEHYLLCPTHLYSKENIQLFYTNLHSEHKMLYMQQTAHNSIRWMDIGNFLLMGIIEGAAHIQHQTHLLNFLLACCNCNNKHACKSTVYLCLQLHQFLALLEAIFQSPNPLEAARFMIHSPYKNQLNKKMWRALVKDIANSYSQKSLEIYKSYLEEFQSYADQIKQ